MLILIVALGHYIYGPFGALNSYRKLVNELFLKIASNFLRVGIMKVKTMSSSWILQGNAQWSIEGLTKLTLAFRRMNFTKLPSNSVGN